MTIKNLFMALSMDPNKVSLILEECADKYIVPRFGTLKDDEVFTKSGPNDLVTIADQETEAALEIILPTLIPGSIVLGEEGVAEGRMDVNILKDPDQVIWVVDPVDGTHNFRHGKEQYGMIVSLVAGGEVIKGWIYDIPGKRMMVTEKNGGTRINNQPIMMSKNRPLDEVRGFIYAQNRYPDLPNLKAKVKEITTLRCAAHEYFHLITGKADFGISSNVKPWDHLAGSLAIREAGGLSSKWDGKMYVPEDSMGSSLLNATDEKLWWEVYETILKSKMNGNSPSI